MTTYLQIISVFESFATLHKQVQSFDANLKTIKPSLFPYLKIKVLKVESLILEKSICYHLEINLHDKLLPAFNNQQEVLDDLLSIAHDLYMYLDKYSGELSISEELRATPFYEDDTIGWKVLLDISTVFIAKTANIPML